MVLSSLTIVNILEKTIHTQSCLMYWWPTLHICLVNSINILSHINNIIKYRSRFNSNNSLLLFGSLGTCTSPVSLNKTRIPPVFNVIQKSFLDKSMSQFFFTCALSTQSNKSKHFFELRRIFWYWGDPHELRVPKWRHTWRFTH